MVAGGTAPSPTVDVMTDRSPDFSRSVLDDIYRYREARPEVAWALWLFTGILGGHRFYVGRIGTGLLMLVTGGVGGIWWLLDVLRVKALVRDFNDRQAAREDVGLPPLGMEAMPPLPTDRELQGDPEWAHRRGGRVRLVGDAVVLLVAGVSLGAITASRGDFEALAAVLALIAITVLGARWDPHLPLLEELDRWSHRLRLYYRFNDPGGPLALLVRPLAGPITAPFRKRARAEVRLYLQLGAVFTIGFTLLDVAQAFSFGSADLDGTALVGDLFVTLITVYAFATPIGAILTTHLLLERSDRVVWGLSGVSLLAIVMGMFGL